MKCYFCNNDIRGIGHDPYPMIVPDGALACSKCERNVVFPFILNMLNHEDKEGI